MDFNPEPKIIKPFNDRQMRKIRTHIEHVRHCFDWPGIPYHDANEPEESRFNRWAWHNLPMLRALHHSPNFIRLASSTFGQEVKPSYCFLSMYGPNGVCPPHKDRPQCQFTIDLQISSDCLWPIYIRKNFGEDPTSYVIADGQAIAYSGTGQTHFRKPMPEDSVKKRAEGYDSVTLERGTRMDLAFFHFVPVSWQGEVG